LLIEYFREHKELPSRADGNWRITPESALAVLEQELRGPMRR
jgi:hypothetical protein